MLKLAESVALQRGFAVSWVTINGVEHAFNHPTRYLHSLLENLRVPGVAARGLVELCSHWLANSQGANLLHWTSSRHAPWEFSWPIDRLRTSGNEDANSSSEWYFSMLEGRDLQQKSGCNYFPDFYRRLEATVSLCRAMGLNGVVFLFDEIESIATHMNNIRSRLLSYQVMNALVDARRFPHSMFLFATTEDLGARISSDVFGYPEYETSYAEGYRFAKKWHAKDVQILPVKSVSKNDNKKLFFRIREAHAAAYGWDAKARISDAFVGQLVESAAKLALSQREITRSFVNILEICQQHLTCDPAHELFDTPLNVIGVDPHSSEKLLHEQLLAAPELAQPHSEIDSTTSEPIAEPLEESQAAAPVTAKRAWLDLILELQAYATQCSSPPNLAAFLNERELKLEDLYRDSNPSGWTGLQRDARILLDVPSREEEYFGRRFSDLLHIDDPQQILMLAEAAKPDCNYNLLGPEECLRLQMLTYQIDGQHSQVGSGARLLERLKASPHSREELAELAEILFARTNLESQHLPGLPGVTLCLHAAYKTREILTAFGWLTATQRTPFQAGVLAFPDRKVELLFVTLDKGEELRPEIAYRDYPIGSARFHWQSQNATGSETPSGQRYVDSATNGWTYQLFVRPSKGQAYRACGPVTIESTTGSRPMSIIWKLEVPLPPYLVTTTEAHSSVK